MFPSSDHRRSSFRFRCLAEKIESSVIAGIVVWIPPYNGHVLYYNKTETARRDNGKS